MIRGQIGMGHAHLSTGIVDSHHTVCYCIPRHVWDAKIAEKETKASSANIDFLFRKKVSLKLPPLYQLLPYMDSVPKIEHTRCPSSYLPPPLALPLVVPEMG